MKTRVFSIAAVVAILTAALFGGGGVAGATPPSYGLLRVTTSPALPSQISVDGIPRNTWGLAWVKFDPGSHQVCFGDVAGYTTPPCQTVTVVAGVTTTVVGAFTQRGYLQVMTSPPSPSRISIDGIPRDNWGVFTDLPTGSHQVCFGAVAGLDPPPCQTVTVTAGTTTPVTGTFTSNPSAPGLSGVGMLRVTTSPSVPSQIMVDGQIANTWGLSWLELPPGPHQVCFGAVAGFITPACQSATVVEGATTTVTGAFTQRGYLQVMTSPALPSTISVDGVARGDWGVFTDLPTGSHQVCFGGVAGYSAPPCQNVTLSAGTVTPVIGVFSQVTTGTWVELKTAGGTESWIPADANRSGLVVGEGYYCTGSCATSGQLSIPGGFQASDLTYRTVRDNGAIAGYTLDGQGGTVSAVVWTSPSASGAELSMPAGWTNPYAHVVTANGSIIGQGTNPVDGLPYALLWSSPSVTPTTIPSPTGWSYSKAEGYGDNGTVVGWGTTGNGMYHGLVVPPPGYQATPLVDVNPADFQKGGAAFQINNNGLIVGVGIDAQDKQHPVAWSSSVAAPIAMDMPGGYTFGTVTAVEDNGMVIGTAKDSGGNNRVLVWTSPNAGATVLSLPAGSELTSLVGVLANGTIVGNAQDSGGNEASFVWASASSSGVRLQGPPGYTDTLAAGISTDGVIYGAAQTPSGGSGIVAWPTPGAAPVAIVAPPGYTSVTMSVVRQGAPVTAWGYDANGDPKGLVFIF